MNITNTDDIRKVAIVGAGVSGLTAARHFTEAGFEVTVFEKTSKIGGVWAVTFPGATLQNTGDQYAFQDYPVPKSWGYYYHPNKDELMDYFESYVDHFNLRRLIKFKHELITIQHRSGERFPDSPNAIRGWKLHIRHPVDPSPNDHDLPQVHEFDEEFDFLLMAQGMYTNDPNIPHVTNSHLFKGVAIHDRQFTDDKILDNKQSVVVVGFGKTAMDLAMKSANHPDSSKAPKQTHLVVRATRWGIPNTVKGVHYKFLLFNRINLIAMPCWTHSPIESYLFKGTASFPKHFWDMISTVVSAENQYTATNPLRPKRRLEADLRSASALLPDGFYQTIREGKIIPHVDTVVEEMTEDSVILGNGEKVNADLVIYATGFRSKFSWLPEVYRSKVVEDDGIHLYRHLIHPELPDMAFIGFAHGFLHLPLTEISTLWLLAHLRGLKTLPSIEKQQTELTAVKHWKQSNAAYEPGRAMTVGTRFLQVLDEYCRDLRVDPYRKLARWGWWNPIGWFMEWLEPYGPKDYMGLFRKVLGAKG
ncbi:hypothetical protein HDU76_004400, partial [Blyttiomyces sp. JEL0837]